MFFRYEEWNFLRKFNKKVLVKLILGHFQVKISEQGQNGKLKLNGLHKDNLLAWEINKNKRYKFLNSKKRKHIDL